MADTQAVKIARLEEKINAITDNLGKLTIAVSELKGSMIAQTEQLTRINTSMTTEIASHRARLDLIDKTVIEVRDSTNNRINSLKSEVTLNSELRRTFEFFIKFKNIIIPGALIYLVSSLVGTILLFIELRNKVP